MANIALLYMSIDGQTKKIAEKLAESLVKWNNTISMHSISTLTETFSLEPYEAVILGCSVRYGKHHPQFRQFVQGHIQQLNTKKNFFIFFTSVNLTARKPNRSDVSMNPYIKKYLKQISWKPDDTEVFAGALKYGQYGFLDRLLIRFIMKITGGPTHSEHDIEYTEWDKVRVFSQKIQKHIKEL